MWWQVPVHPDAVLYEVDDGVAGVVFDRAVEAALSERLGDQVECLDGEAVHPDDPLPCPSRRPRV